MCSEQIVESRANICRNVECLHRYDQTNLLRPAMNTSLDDIDRQLLSLLQTNAREGTALGVVAHDRHFWSSSRSS